MEELKNTLHALADDAVNMVDVTFDMFPDVTSLSECFPYSACRTITIDGHDYTIRYKVELKPIEW
jgi:hypothetical protein